MEQICRITDRGWEIQLPGMPQPIIMPDVQDCLESLAGAVYYNTEAIFIQTDTPWFSYRHQNFTIHIIIAIDNGVRSYQYVVDASSYVKNIVLPTPVVERHIAIFSVPVNLPIYKLRIAKYTLYGGYGLPKLNRIFLENNILHFDQVNGVFPQRLTPHGEFWQFGAFAYLKRKEWIFAILLAIAEDNNFEIEQMLYSAFENKDKL